MICFKDNRLNLTLIGASLVTSGVVLKNSMEQLNRADSPLNTMVGPALFIVGWAIVAYSIALPDGTKKYIANLEINQKTVQSFTAAALIVVAVFMMKNLMKSGKQIPMIFPAMFASGWLLLGYTVGGRYGAAAALLVLTSMMSVLPWQRKMCIVDGPGMVMFTVAWFLLAAGNAK